MVRAFCGVSNIISHALHLLDAGKAYDLKGIKMGIVANKWLEKQVKKFEQQTAPAYKPEKPKGSIDVRDFPDFIPVNANKPAKRHSKCLKTNLVRTLRGVRK